MTDKTNHGVFKFTKEIAALTTVWLALMLFLEVDIVGEKNVVL